MAEILSTHKYNRKKLTSLNPRWMPSSPKLGSNDVGDVHHFEGHFREAIWPILLIAQLFGAMPLYGIKGRSSSSLRLKWISLRTVYSLLVLAILTSYTLFLAWKTFTKEVKFSSIAILLFYVSNTCGLICLLRVSMKWPVLMKYWIAVETKLPTFCNEKQRRNFILKLRLLAFTMLAMALVEHALSVFSLLHFVIKCRQNEDPIRDLLNIQIPYLFPSGNKIFVLVFGKFISVIATFMWNYLDVFIVMISIGLSTMFKLYNEDLKRTNRENRSVDYWIYRRLQYGKLRDLVTSVNEIVASCILLTFANELFFLCKQLFQAIRPMPTYSRMIYFWFSVIFQILRALTVSLSAACVNDESKKPINILYAVPSHSWNKETKRFLDEVKGTDIALSGMNFFFVTRKFILSVSSLILTYEFILLQFQSNTTMDKLCYAASNKTL